MENKVEVPSARPGGVAEDEAALRRLAYNYARGVDRRDEAVFLSAFAPDARLHVCRPGGSEEPYTTMEGHDQLAQVPVRITRYDRTYHFLGNTGYDIDGDQATGEVYCRAEHLTPDSHGGTVFTMFIRYQDHYRRGSDGWRITERSVVVDWTSVGTALADGGPKTRS